jgi:hypothetical protein
VTGTVPSPPGARYPVTGRDPQAARGPGAPARDRNRTFPPGSTIPRHGPEPAGRRWPRRSARSCNGRSRAWLTHPGPAAARRIEPGGPCTQSRPRISWRSRRARPLLSSVRSAPSVHSPSQTGIAQTARDSEVMPQDERKRGRRGWGGVSSGGGGSGSAPGRRGEGCEYPQASGFEPGGTKPGGRGSRPRSYRILADPLLRLPAGPRGGRRPDRDDREGIPAR